MIPYEVATRIAAVVTFGDPEIGRDITNVEPPRVDVLCDKKDPICKGEPFPFGSHLTYGTTHFLGDGVKFAVEKINSFTPGPRFTASFRTKPNPVEQPGH
jgi:hypothetical protein